ncbi:SRPBCC family protein [Flavobacteriaceae bacterium F08102]|nr:SRPBCC family protein [Flavobacteriaceae bacterium F08102]
MNLQSPKVSVQQSATYVFDYLSKVENYEHIMPKNTDKFEVRPNGFLFALKGMPEIKLLLNETRPNDLVVLGSASDKFPFTLQAEIEEINEESSMVQLSFDGKFNAMMAMMIKNPLQNFINNLTENISAL